MNVVRINFSHQKHEALRVSLERIRRVSAETGIPLAILGDLRGPRIRVGEMTGGAITLATGSEVILSPLPCVGTPERISVSFPCWRATCSRARRSCSTTATCCCACTPCAAATARSSRASNAAACFPATAGINLPGQRVSLPSVTEKDEADIALAVELGFDFLALSFVQSADDVRGLQARLTALGADIPVIAKIEKKSALDDIAAIAETAYGVMVARGDLALEMSLPEVPVAQKRIIAVCRQAARPVITATQMLESMTHSPKPTRAEATDVANAVFDGTDAVMLSGESAMGEFPVETVATMSAIAARAEAAWLTGEVAPPPPLRETGKLEWVVAHAAKEIAAAVGARAIVTHTTSGSTTRRVTCHRPIHAGAGAVHGGAHPAAVVPALGRRKQADAGNRAHLARHRAGACRPPWNAAARSPATRWSSWRARPTSSAGAPTSSRSKRCRARTTPIRKRGERARLR